MPGRNRQRKARRRAFTCGLIKAEVQARSVNCEPQPGVEVAAQALGGRQLGERGNPPSLRDVPLLVREAALFLRGPSLLLSNSFLLDGNAPLPIGQAGEREGDDETGREACR